MKPVQYFYKSAHMGSFEVVRKVYIHVYIGNGLLQLLRLVKNSNRVRDVFNPDLFDVDLTMILLALDVLHGMAIINKKSTVLIFQERCLFTAALSSSRLEDFTI